MTNLMLAVKEVLDPLIERREESVQLDTTYCPEQLWLWH